MWMSPHLILLLLLVYFPSTFLPGCMKERLHVSAILSVLLSCGCKLCQCMQGSVSRCLLIFPK